MPGKYSNTFISICLFLLSAGWKNSSWTTTAFSHSPKRSHDEAEQLKSRASQRAIDSAKHLIPWLKKHGYSTSLLFLADMSLSMELKRFYVVQPDSGIILNSFLVAHGSGKGSTADSVVCSNVPGSLCTSLGKYRLADTLWGEYGKGYWLDGLDASNNNARKRLIVFHYYIFQTTEEFHDHNYFSSGCPMLAKSSFYYCDKLIQNQKKPVLMYLYR